MTLIDMRNYGDFYTVKGREEYTWNSWVHQVSLHAFLLSDISG